MSQRTSEEQLDVTTKRNIRHVIVIAGDRRCFPGFVVDYKMRVVCIQIEAILFSIDLIAGRSYQAVVLKHIDHVDSFQKNSK
jgi:hypothetical protein